MKHSAYVMVPVALSVAMALNTAQAAANNGEEDSVYQWGRWEVLSTAAGQQVAPQVPRQISQLGTDDYEKEFVLIAPEEPDPIPQEEDPIPSCQAGATCGFATRNAGDTRSTGADAEFNTFSETFMSADGGEGQAGFILNEDESDEIRAENLIVLGRKPGRIVATTLDRSTFADTQNYDDNSVSGTWFFTNEDTELGWFAAGNALSQNDIDYLNAGAVPAQFSGPMASGLTNVNMSVQFGSGASWNGAWSGAHNFQAAGNLNGPSLIQTSITGADGLVEGFIAGNQVDMAAILKVDVETTNGIYRDVGRIPGGVVDGGSGNTDIEVSGVR